MSATLLFGDRGDFAIEAGRDAIIPGHTEFWGHMCVWCRGIALGDSSDPNCGLSFAYYEFRGIVERLDDLWDVCFDSMNDLDTLNFLDGHLYGYHGEVELKDERTLEEIHRDSRRWMKFDFLTNWGESFNGIKAFLLCPPGDSVRILSGRFPAAAGIRVDVSRTAVIAAITDFGTWFEAERNLGGETTA